MVQGEFIEEDDSSNFIKEQKIKEQFLDDAFKKAEVKHGVKQPDNKKIKKTNYKKKFPKLWILLMITAAIGLVCVNYMPWGYIKYDTDGSEIEISITRDFKLHNVSEEITNSTIITNISSVFLEPYYIGLSDEDFTSSSNLASYGFILLIALGISIIILGILDKLLNFSKETFIRIHFVLTTIIIFPCMFVVLSLIKFLGAQILSYYNLPFVSIKITAIAFPAAFLLITIGFILARLSLTVIKIDFKEMQKILKENAPRTTSGYNR